jgi:hypothetical protein
MTNYRVALICTGRVGYRFRFGDLPVKPADGVQAQPHCNLVTGVNRAKEKIAKMKKPAPLGPALFIFGSGGVICAVPTVAKRIQLK